MVHDKAAEAQEGHPANRAAVWPVSAQVAPVPIPDVAEPPEVAPDRPVEVGFRFGWLPLALAALAAVVGAAIWL
jgi:hypothetical protein